MNKLISTCLLGLAATTAACSFYARSPEEYRDATQAVLAKKSPDMQACYNSVLLTTPNAAGTVAVNFTVEEKTGNIKDAKVDPAKSTAPAAVQSCVTNSLTGLSVQPPDQRTGQASFTWDFEPNGTPASPTPTPSPAPASSGT
jgi:hypothetical protein